MAEVWVAAEEAARGDLPPLCARRGIRCITRYPEPARVVPAAVEWATWWRAWPLGGAADERRIVLPLLPLHRRVAAWLESARDVTAGALALAVPLALLASGMLATAAVAVAWAALVIHFGVAVAGVVGTVRATPDSTGRWVHLSGVSPRFARAVEATCRTPTHQPQPAAWRPRRPAAR